MNGLCNRRNVCRDSVIGRRGQKHCRCVRILNQRSFDLFLCQRARQGCPRHDIRIQINRHQPPQINAVVNRLVAVARQNQLPALRHCCRNCGQKPCRASVDTVVTAIRAIQRRRLFLRVFQNSFGIVQIVKTVDLCNVQSRRSLQRLRKIRQRLCKPPFMSRHVKGIVIAVCISRQTLSQCPLRHGFLISFCSYCALCAPEASPSGSSIYPQSSRPMLPGSAGCGTGSAATYASG